jgi:hypothetical protein
MGAIRMAELGAGLQSAGKEGDFAVAAPLLSEMEDEFPRTCMGLEGFLHPPRLAPGLARAS